MFELFEFAFFCAVKGCRPGLDLKVSIKARLFGKGALQHIVIKAAMCGDCFNGFV